MKVPVPGPSLAYDEKLISHLMAVPGISKLNHKHVYRELQ